MVAPGVESCPKCGTPATDTRACPRCGLARERMADYAARRDAEVPEPVAAAWQAAVAAWDDARRHDAVFQLTAQHASYPWTAAQYRERARAVPGDPIAERQIERLRRAAEATMRATATVRADATPKPFRNLIAVVVLIAALIIVALVFAIGLRRTSPANNAQPATLPRPVHPGPTK